VDRLLDLGFQEEVEELVSHCPKSRQTLLFSATMTPKVDDLVKLSLRKPVRVKTASKATKVAARLVQEFVKVLYIYLYKYVCIYVCTCMRV
jgi:ATP-dependent RNA helicase DDX27